MSRKLQVRRQRWSNWTPLKKHEDDAIEEEHDCLWTKMKIHQLALSNTNHEDAIKEVRRAQCLRLVNKWGYKEGSYGLWTKILEIDEDFFQIRKDDDAYNFAAYDCATKVDDDEVVEWFKDNEDNRTTALIDRIDVNVPINYGDIVARLLDRPKKKIDDGDEYYSDELDNSYLDESDDDEGPKFERFRKEQLSKNYNFKWGM
ncbi:hypothetical protein KIW84_014792 [Lathyrus oleraceus]|uniref:Uncharacterized protein n=1 Tax=Pisum sativum TaxID=3888 RepID=A0A9D5GZQ2_PEA|nr:hypothetical protein KIW84_014792 [Pisum sativum]